MNPKPFAVLKNFTVPFCIYLFPCSPPTVGSIVPQKIRTQGPGRRASVHGSGRQIVFFDKVFLCVINDAYWHAKPRNHFMRGWAILLGARAASCNSVNQILIFTRAGSSEVTSTAFSGWLSTTTR
jgi:hypothetical protein